MGKGNMTTGFINQRLSMSVTSGFIGGPLWNTTVNAISSGREARNKNWKYPRQQYTANVGAFNASDRAELLGLFYATAGQWGAFRFRDCVDYVASGEGLLVASGTLTPVQLVKTYTFGPTAFSRPIQAPVDGSVKVFTGITAIDGTVDSTSGLFTPSENWPATPVQWSGQFDVWVRFTADYVPFTAVRNDLLTAAIDLLEVTI